MHVKIIDGRGLDTVGVAQIARDYLKKVIVHETEPPNVLNIIAGNSGDIQELAKQKIIVGRISY